MKFNDFVLKASVRSRYPMGVGRKDRLSAPCITFVKQKTQRKVKRNADRLNVVTIGPAPTNSQPHAASPVLTKVAHGIYGYTVADDYFGHRRHLR
jgi:hypothetical protein